MACRSMGDYPPASKPSVSYPPAIGFSLRSLSIIERLRLCDDLHGLRLLGGAWASTFHLYRQLHSTLNPTPKWRGGGT